jgi:hypothetical protein
MEMRVERLERFGFRPPIIRGVFETDDARIVKVLLDVCNHSALRCLNPEDVLRFPEIDKEVVESIQAGITPEPEGDEPLPELEQMTKAELREWADERGIFMAARLTRDKMAFSIREKFPDGKYKPSIFTDGKYKPSIEEQEEEPVVEEVNDGQVETEGS